MAFAAQKDLALPAGLRSFTSECSIAYCEALADVLRGLQFVDQGDGIVLCRDATGTGLIDDEVILAEAEFPRAFARLNHRRWAEIGPVEARFTQNFLGIAVSDRDPHPFRR